MTVISRQEESRKFSVGECSLSGVDEGGSKPVKQAKLVVHQDVPYDGGCRRQSTRNRQLTTKALGALEIELMGPGEGRKRSLPRPIDDKTWPAKQGRSDYCGQVVRRLGLSTAELAS